MAVKSSKPVSSPELSDEIWRPESVPVWWRRWTWGWRGLLTGAVLLAGYGVWRGPADYAAFKAWRGRALAERSRVAEREGRSDEARQLLDRAGVLAPRDEVVLRAMADFAEPRSDVMALYALRQLQAIGRAEEADVVRQARLAFDWGHPGLAPAGILRGWATAPAGGQTIDRLEMGARWLATRGLLAEAEARMRRAADVAVERGAIGEARRLNLGLARLLITPSGGPPDGVRVREAVLRWLTIGRDSNAPPAEVAEALQGAVTALTSTGEADQAAWGDLAVDVREVLSYRLATAPPSTEWGLRLALARLSLLGDPLGGPEVAEDLVLASRAASEQDALTVARWLLRHRFPEAALTLAGERAGAGVAAADWLWIRMDGLAGRKDWAGARATLKEAGTSLPATSRALAEYTIERAAEAESAECTNARERLVAALRSAEPGEALEVAQRLEKAGERKLAIEVYRQWQRHERLGLTARLGLVRCLHEETDEGVELADALQALLTLWPDSDEARADLAYLRLLPPAPPRSDDLDAARRLVAESPQFLAYRVVAALAALRQNRNSEAMATLGEVAVPWAHTHPGWRVVGACALAANARPEEARELAARAPAASLRPGELKLLEQFSLKPGP